MNMSCQSSDTNSDADPTKTVEVQMTLIKPGISREARCEKVCEDAKRRRYRCNECGSVHEFTYREIYTDLQERYDDTRGFFASSIVASDVTMRCEFCNDEIRGFTQLGFFER